MLLTKFIYLYAVAMLANQPTNEDIIECLKTSYGIEITLLIFLPLGADMNAMVFKAQSHEGRRYFIKLKRAYNHEMSIAITKVLYEAGIQQVIVPVHSITGQEIQRIGDFTLIVYPFIEGEDGFSRELSNDQWFLLGKMLRQIHSIELPSHIKSKIRKEAYSNTWRKSVRSLINSIESKVQQDEIALQLLEFIKEKKAIILRLVERAEALSQNLKEQPTNFVLCHSDIHGGNVLIDKNNTIYIVDWDEPMLAPKERDLMFIGGGVANVWNKPQEEEFFYKGYGIANINRTILAYYRHERIVEDIALISQEILMNPLVESDRQKIYKQFVDMFEPRGVVDIAFKTDTAYQQDN